MMDFKYSANVSATAPKYVSTNKVADHFQVNVSTVRQWVSRGRIPDLPISIRRCGSRL